MIIAFPPSTRTAQRLASDLRSRGFYTLPDRIWNSVADLAEHFAEATPTHVQLNWLQYVHQHLLEARDGH
jgi:hypothetical protein